ncbi:MAG TPA: mechanosensitive ion channel domain-containing protein [Sedimentisphaerales bacterium]|nr:mechanosensitive ion channel domain-containing protein [Sedimentisphaerales bacterium]
MNIDIEAILQKVYEYLAQYGFKVIGALIIFLIGRWLVKIISRWIEKALIKSRVDKTLAKFVKNLSQIVLLVFVVMAALAPLGVETTQFAVVVGAAGLAIGLALQGSLANFASGFLMIIFRPFKVGDFIEAAGVKGTVKEIQIFNTIINTPDNIRVIIPNAQITGGNVLNYTANGTRRVNLVVGVSYEADLKEAKKVIEGVLASDDRVLNDPAPTVAVSELGDSSVNFVVRPWVNSTDYWAAYFDMTAKIKLALDENDITIPFPQRDVHIKNESRQSF